jgi:hypothetical protein
LIAPEALATLDSRFANARPVSVGNAIKCKEPRREWRINQKTGELRGVVWRTPDKQRKSVRYVGKGRKGKPTHDYLIHESIFREWRRANRTLDPSGIRIPDRVGKDETG